MEVQEQKEYRNMTISTKVTPAEKIELARIADKYKITLSELCYSLIISFKDFYEYIGRETPKEEKLQEEIKQQKKLNRKLSLDLENADYHIGMKAELLLQTNKKNDDYRYKLVQFKKENEKLKTSNNQLPNELIKFNKLRYEIEKRERR